VIITGAAGGIGGAAAAELRRQGARVVGLDVHADGDDVIECDIRDQESVDHAVAAAIEQLGGGLDVLINNADVGIALDGAVPAEDLSEAAATLARAALSPKPIRDLATTRRGTVNYALVRLAPRGVMDRLTRWQAGRLARKGHFDSSEMAADFTAGLRR